MRLDKYISFALGITRSNIASFLKGNIVKVNDERVIKKDFKIDENKDTVTINDEVIEYKAFVYFVLNKPKDYVCARVDNLSKTVVSLIDTNYEISPVGRLDKDTKGVLLLTNDGALSHKLLSPLKHVSKEYIALVDKKLTEDELNEFMKGIIIKDGDEEEFKTKECFIKFLEEKDLMYSYLVKIYEGKFHQVKRMFKYFDSNVIDLERVSFGPLKLEGLKEGEYRGLTKDELNELKNAVCQ